MEQSLTFDHLDDVDLSRIDQFHLQLLHDVVNICIFVNEIDVGVARFGNNLVSSHFFEIYKEFSLFPHVVQEIFHLIVDFVFDFRPEILLVDPRSRQITLFIQRSLDIPRGVFILLGEAAADADCAALL